MLFTKLRYDELADKYYAENGSEPIAVGQVVYVDFTSTSAKYTNTAINTVVDVAMTDSGYTAEQQTSIIAELNALDNNTAYVASVDGLTASTYSTIYVGNTGTSFDTLLGENKDTVKGISETTGGVSSANAFVLTQNLATDIYTTADINENIDELVYVIAAKADQLSGSSGYSQSEPPAVSDFTHTAEISGCHFYVSGGTVGDSAAIIAGTDKYTGTVAGTTAPDTAALAGDNWAVVTGFTSPIKAANINKVVFYGNSNTGANGGTIQYNGSVTISNSVFMYSSTITSGSGGAVFIGGDYDDKVISAATFIGNHSASHGGAVRIDKGTSTIENSVFSGNYTASGREGGAIYFHRDTTDGTRMISSTVFSGNSAGAGGAIRSVGQLSLEQVNFSGNSAVNGQGGAVYVNDGALNIDGGFFESNSASQNGGAIYLAAGDFAHTVKNVDFTGNNAKGSNGGGGAIYNAGNLTLSGTVNFDNNSSSSGYSGAVYNAADSAVYVKGNIVLKQESDNIHNEGSIVIDVNDFSTELASSPVTVIDNQANDRWLYGNNGITLKNGDTEITVQGDNGYYWWNDNSGYHIDNIAESTNITTKFYTSYDTSAFARVTVCGQEFVRVQGSTYGKIITLNSLNTSEENVDTILIAGTEENRIKAASNITNAYSVNIRNGATGGLKYVDFDNNSTGREYAAVGVVNGATACIENVNFSNNYNNKRTRQGGAIFNSGGTVTLAGTVTFDNNKAEHEESGAFYNSGTIYVKGNIVLKQTTDNIENAGSIIIDVNDYSEALAVSPVTVIDNQANDQWLYGGKKVITLKNGNEEITVQGTDGYFWSNDNSGYSIAKIEGEGLVTTKFYTNYATNTLAYVTVNGINFVRTGDSSTFESIDVNTASDVVLVAGTEAERIQSTGTSTQYGVCNNCGTVALKYVTFDGQNVERSQAAVYVSSTSASTYIEDVTFTGNKTSTTGGAIYNNGNMTLSGAIGFSGNSANRGGAVFMTGAALSLDNAEFIGNSATGSSARGGALEIRSVKEESTISNVKFINNSADDRGGAINSQAANLTLDNAAFAGNTATNGGGAMYISGNETTGSGDVFYSKVTIKDSKFLTFSDSIQNVGSLTFCGENIINANATGGTITATGASFIFHDYSGLSEYESYKPADGWAAPASITVSGALAGAASLTFRGKEGVNFSNGTLGEATTITIEGDLASWFSGDTATLTFATKLNGLENVSITVTDTVDNNGNGNDDTATITADSNVVVVDGKVYTVGTAGNSLTLSLKNDTSDFKVTDAADFNTIVQNDSVTEITLTEVDSNAKDLYASGKKLIVEDNITSSYFYLYGGGKGTESNLSGDVSIQGKNVNLDRAYGSGYIVADSSTTVSGQLNNELHIAETATGFEANRLYGGGYANSTKSWTIININSNTKLTIDSDVVINDFVTGGWMVAGYADLSVTGNSEMNISAGTYDKQISGAGYIANSKATLSLTGTSSVNISGGTFNGNVYGGFTICNSKVNSAACGINGSTAITIDSTSGKNITFTYGIYAGSQDSGKITGNTTVTFKGDAGKISIGGNVSGDSFYASETTHSGGTRSLVFDDLENTFSKAQSFINFDSVTVKNQSNLTLDNAVDLSGITEWNFDYDSKLTWNWADDTETVSHFAGDTINLTWGDGDSSEFTDEKIIFTGNTDGWDSATVKLFSESNAVWNAGTETTCAYWSSGDYKLYADGNGNLKITTGSLAKA